MISSCNSWGVMPKVNRGMCLYTDPEKTIRCPTCDCVIGLSSHYYHCGGEILCVPCMEDFHKIHNDEILNFIDDLVLQFARTRTKRSGEKAT